MTSHPWLLLSMLALAATVRSQEYHYQRPQVPFSEVSARHQQPAKYVVQTLGPNSRTYALESHLAPSVYENHQTVVVRAQRGQQNQLGYGYQGPQQQQQQQQYVAPQQQFQQQQYVAHQQQQYVAPQLNMQYLAPQPVQQPQLHYSTYRNPLLGSGSYQQFSSALAAPLSTQALAPPAPPAPLNYYQPQAQPQPPTQAIAQYQGVPQPAAQYLPQPQNLAPQRLYFANPHPYATVTLPSGQQVLDAGHGSGVPPTAVLNKLLTSTGLTEPAPRKGDQVAQSESASLDGYDYKQTAPGDTREYQRYVTNCQPNGQCQQQILSPGQVDPGHKQLLQDIRAVAHAHIEGCTKSPAIYVPPGTVQNGQGQLRPRNRRTYERKEELIERHPFN
ncbi:GL23212 [Drosophila persimilis]|uniref:GL23212 n=1 Tax=Drosophila persimilis TaxID=7234 RepID=B4G5A9_DROPE|nr:GL23212 [Drosophila persimilis]